MVVATRGPPHWQLARDSRPLMGEEWGRVARRAEGSAGAREGSAGAREGVDARTHALASFGAHARLTHTRTHTRGGGTSLVNLA